MISPLVIPSFYLPLPSFLPSLQLLQVFDYGDIEEFQQYFALLDVDSSGDLSKSEIKLLLKSLGIEVTVPTHRCTARPMPL